MMKPKQEIFFKGNFKFLFYFPAYFTEEKIPASHVGTPKKFY